MMRLKEWYGWHFPEMAKIIPDGIMYAKIIKRSGKIIAHFSYFRGLFMYGHITDWVIGGYVGPSVWSY